jgi:lysophospholipase L1-like esterase
VQAFGETIVINSDATAIAVSSFSIDTFQQDAYYDNIVYTPESDINIIEPVAGHIQTIDSLTVKSTASGLQDGWGVKFVLDGGEYGEQTIIDRSEPYEVVFCGISKSEHRIDVYIVDELDEIQEGENNHDSVQNIARGDILIAFGDSVTYGYGDDLHDDDISVDGRNTGGGFEPVLNDYLTTAKDYPHSIVNEGVEGITSSEGLEILPSVLSKHPESSSYLLLFGMNDARPWDTVPSGFGLNPGDDGYEGSFKCNMQQMINLINSNGKEAVLAKIPIALADSATSEELYPDPDTGARSVAIKEYNQVIDELVGDEANDIIVNPPDFYTYFKDNYADEYFDNIHPNGIGYRSIADMWVNVLTK